MHEDVPKYLKLDQSKEIKNRRISARELNQLLQGFWQHRLAASSQESQLPVRMCVLVLYKFVPVCIYCW